MKSFAPPWALVLTLLFQGSFFIPMTYAQSALDDIKTKLQEQGIEVVDYSAPENQWGSLGADWVTLLSGGGYDSLEDLAKDYEDYFQSETGISDVRRQIAVAEIEKSRLNNDADRQKKEDEINQLKEKLNDLEVDLKEELRTLVSGLDYEFIGEKQTPEQVEEGVNVIFQEINFYFNYNKWGAIPDRIVAILRSNNFPYQNIQEFAGTITKDSSETIDQGIEFWSAAFSNYQGLSSQDIETIVNALKIYIAGSSGEAQISTLGNVLVNSIQNLAAGLAILWIVISGVRLVFADGDEGVISEQKSSILYGVLGLVIILIIGRIIETLYGAPGEIRNALTPDEGFSNEIYGLVNFLKALVGVIAVFAIVISGIRTLFAQGDEGEVTKERTSVLWVGAGLILVAINEIIIRNIFVIPASQGDQLTTSNIAQIINTIGNVLQFLLGFVGVITLGILIYGAATMILNFGDDEAVGNAKKIIRNAIVGIIIILSAYVIVASLISFG